VALAAAIIVLLGLFSDPEFRAASEAQEEAWNRGELKQRTE
jgi:hypothetical protein